VAKLAAGCKASKSGVSIQNGSLVNARQGYINFASAPVFRTASCLRADHVRLILVHLPR